ncbi:thioredoxin domain-containing protein [Streptococcus orisratti]|uniref:thioredoxin domain-containing protein n=1 Tax=Streptococcus orisratti TaxID=114652 RepID=UPI0023F9AF75|nr:thioredoxin domain-containing protein [Streptococcus orisratti]
MNLFGKKLSRKKQVVILLLCLVGLICGKLANDYYVKAYHTQLTAKVYRDTIIKKNVNIVFYKKTCPYCRAGVSKIKEEARKSNITTYFVDVETTDGVAVARKFGIQHSPVLVKICDDKVSTGNYAYDKNGKIFVDNKFIEAAFSK